MTEPRDDLVLGRIDEWRRRLIDLSFRNRLIKYRPTKASTLEIASPDLSVLLADLTEANTWNFYLPPDPVEDADTDESDAALFVEDAVMSKAQHRGRAPRSDEIVVTETDARRITRTLENLARKSNAEFQDKALRILYIAAGFLDWTDPIREEQLSSPLVLIPVQLQRLAPSYPHTLRFVDDEEIVVNPSLTEKLRRDLGREIPLEWAWEDKAIDTELDEIEAAVEGAGWTVRRSAVLGLFSFQKYVMYRDLLDNENRIALHPVVRAFADRSADVGSTLGDVEIPPLEDLDEVQTPELDLSILDADSTQRRCIAAAERGQSFVMQGPPGTGKSQTIANIISSAIGNGKRVLFVSEKAAALDVVHKRLKAEGLDEFCLMLHGEHAARREVVDALHRSLTGELVPSPGLTSHELERLQDLRRLLNSTAQLMHLPMPLLADRSMYEVLGDLAELHAAPSLPKSPEASDLSGGDVRREFQQLDEIFQRIAERWRVSPNEFVWRDFGSSRFSTDDHGRVLTLVRSYRSQSDELARTSADSARLLGWPEPINRRAVDNLLRLGEHILVAPALEANWLGSGSSSDVANAANEVSTVFDELAELERQMQDAYPKRTCDEFPPSLEGEYERALRDLDARAGARPAWEASLLPLLNDCIRFLSAAPAALTRLEESARAAALALGQPSASLTRERAAEIAELAAVAFRGEDRPEADWLVQAGLDRARGALAEIRPKLVEYQDRRKQIFERYDAAALDLDAPELAVRFAEDYTKRLAKLSGRYRRDAKTLKAVVRDGRMPPTVADDLTEIATLQGLGREIDAASDRLRRAFGSQFDGRDTDSDRVERAIATATEVSALSAADADLERLASQVAAGSEPNARTAQLADRIRDANHELDQGLDLLTKLLAKHDTLFVNVSIDRLGAALADLHSLFTELHGIHSVLASGSTTDLTTLTAARERATLITRLHDLREHVRTQEPRWKSALGSYYSGASTDREHALATAEWLERFDELTEGLVPEPLRVQLLAEQPRWPDFAGLERVRSAFDQAAHALAELFDADRRTQLEREASQRTFEEAVRLAEELTRSIDDLHDWAEFRTWRERARERGWGEFVAALVEHGVDASLVVGAYRRAYWNRRLEALFEEEPELADRGSTYERWIEEFCDLDKRLVRTAADRVIVARNRMRKTHIAVGGSEVALLRREAAKKRKHIPVRTLLAMIPSLLSDLKPCLMMSPLTVSHFLAPTHDFDIVIFDEASQVPPQDAVNCIYRGRQLIVAGDSRQLPPTPFFQVAEAEETWVEDEESTTEDMESVLDSAESILPQHPLRWHYRSRHEHLIAFSNAHVYGGQLVTFPAAERVSPTKGVKFVHVPDGTYDRGKSGTNRTEARAVAERVLWHLRNDRRSIGVIAFSVAQATAVSEELDRMRIENPEFEERFTGDRLDAVFVKHLESVQGDERDVIVFSVGYGKGQDGRFLMNFGPLNKDGGYRRLNVAITRARELVELVSSVRSADFTLSDKASRGAHLLKEYLRFAESSGVAVEEAVAGDTPEYASKLEGTIADALIELGFAPVAQVGAGAFRVDVGVTGQHEAGRYLLGVETDGRNYAASPTARDRDRLRDVVLRNLGWNVHRVWAFDWVKNRESEVERLRKALESEAPDDDEPLSAESAAPERQRAERTVTELRDAVDSELLPWVVEYERASLTQESFSYEFDVSINRARQRDLLVELLEVEAPVHVDYAIRRLAAVWGLKRVGKHVRRAGLQAVDMVVRAGSAERRGDFLWRPGQDLEVVRSPRWNDDRTWRSIDEIPPEEVDLVIARLREASGGHLGEHLISDVAKVLGFDRVGARIREIVGERIRAAAADEAPAHG